MYSALFLVAGVVLVATIYLLVAHLPFGSPVPPVPVVDLPGMQVPTPQQPALDPGLRAQLDRQRAADLQRLVFSSLIALGVMALVSVVLAWVMAGRVLRPLGTMTAAVRRISADQLDQRLSNRSRRRAEGAGRHLRRAARAARGRLRRTAGRHRGRSRRSRRQHRIPASDVPAGTRGGSRAGEPDRCSARTCQQPARLHRRQDIDLRTIVAQDLADRQADAAAADVRVGHNLLAAPVSGDPELVKRMVANLLDNALRHNVHQGWVRILTTSAAGRATLRVANSGAVIPDDRVHVLLQPFQRLEAGRKARADGLGLGLSIVGAIVDAHHGALRVRPADEGGLDVTVELPAPAVAGPPP